MCVRVHVWYVRERAVRHAPRARAVPGARRYNIVSNKYMHMWYTISKQKPAGVFTSHSRDTHAHARFYRYSAVDRARVGRMAGVARRVPVVHLGGEVPLKEVLSERLKER